MPQTIVAAPPERAEWWLSRAFRVLLAQLLLLIGGLASVALSAVPIYAIAFLPWPEGVAAMRIRWLGYLGMESLGLVGLVITSYGFMLGRRQWQLKMGKLEAGASGDQEGVEPPIAAGQSG